MVNRSMPPDRSATSSKEEKKSSRDRPGSERAKPRRDYDVPELSCAEGGVAHANAEIMLARQALIESEARFRAFMTHSPMASWIVDIDGRYQYASPIYYRMFQVPTADLVGKQIGEIYPPTLAEKYLASNRAAIKAGLPVESIQPGVLPDGGLGEYLVVKFPIRDTNDRQLLCGMALDITERRQTEAQLRDANARLQGLAAAQAAHLRELAAELTRAEQRERDRLYELLHDDVQPLLVAARLSLSSLGSHTPQADCLRVTAEACGHISRVIEVARSLSLQLSPPLIRERGLRPALESLCRWVRDNHGLEVILVSESDVEPQEMELRLLCFNAVRELLMNIVKHAAIECATLTLELLDTAGLRVTVVDHGVGFDPAIISSGSGSGLAAIERRLNMFGGSLRIDSVPGQGTRAAFTVSMGSSAR